uniref:BZIP domain-containing protein n=1 Tax=Arion vulgaris TaxID=1028688 RepID=A0A0B7B2L3_9EUPU
MMSIGENSRDSNNKTMIKRTGKRPGRKPSKIDERAKLERSRQSARECRARKKLRYQYLEELVLNREKAVFALRDEMETYTTWCSDVDDGHVSEDLSRKVSAEGTYSLPTCLVSLEQVIDSSNEDFRRDVHDSHQEVT